MKDLDVRLRDARKRLEKLEADQRYRDTEADFEKWRANLPNTVKVGAFAAGWGNVVDAFKSGRPGDHRDLFTWGRIAACDCDYYAAFLIDCCAMIAIDASRGKSDSYREYSQAVKGTKYAKYSNALVAVGNAISDGEQYALAQILGGTKLAGRWSMEYRDANGNPPPHYYNSARYSDIMAGNS